MNQNLKPTHRLTLTLLIALLGPPFASTAWAVPSTQTVGYLIREDPRDPKSDPAFSVFMELKVVDVDGKSIGWTVQSIKVTQYLEAGKKDIWEESEPTVPTADGLWWTEHTDVDKPTLDEFTESPPLEGTADNEDPNGDDLDYEFQAVGLSASTPILIAVVTYKFIVLDKHPCPCTEIGSGEEEPGEVLDNPGDI